LSQWQRIRNLKTQARLLIFLQDNKITDIQHLADKIERMYDQVYKMSNDIKAIDRRMDTLATHLAQYDIYKRHQAVYRKHKQLSGKKGDDYYDKHSEEIHSYEIANQYLKDTLNGRTDVPINKWKKEHDELTRKRFALCESYYMLKDDTKDVEILRRSVDRLMQEAEREQQPLRRTHNIDL